MLCFILSFCEKVVIDGIDTWMDTEYLRLKNKLWLGIDSGYVSTLGLEYYQWEACSLILTTDISFFGFCSDIFKIHSLSIQSAAGKKLKTDSKPSGLITKLVKEIRYILETKVYWISIMVVRWMVNLFLFWQTTVPFLLDPYGGKHPLILQQKGKNSDLWTFKVDCW